MFTSFDLKKMFVTVVPHSKKEEMVMLHKIEINEEQWQYLPNVFALARRSDLVSFDLGMNIVGIKQIGDDEFFIIKRKNDKCSITRIHFGPGVLDTIVLYHKCFLDYYVLTDDTFIFNDGEVYSIERRCNPPEAYWLKYKNFSVIEDSNSSKKYILVTETINSTRFPNYIQAIVDTETFKPIGKAYSSLRDSFIELSDDFRFNDLVEQDRCYSSRINSYFYNDTHIRLQNAKNHLLVMLNISPK